MHFDTQTRRSWIEVNLSQLVKNYYIYRKQLSQPVKIMAVVKADAYGHGDVAVCKALETAGVEFFCVSNIDEAKTIRNDGIKGEILILGYTPIECCVDLIKHNITQTLLSEEYAEAILNSGLKIKCQLAIDTGMNRIGIDADDVDSCEKIIREYAKKLQLTGLFTHLCVADAEDFTSVIFTKDQIRKFHAITEKVQDLQIPNIHCMNSAGGLFYGGGDIVRLGIILYGLKPNISNALPEGISPVLTWKSTIAMVKDVKPGETIGYGRAFKVIKPMRIATIPTGYADGYRRDLSNKWYVIINGNKAPITGRICMDMMMVDVTGIQCRTNDEVVLIGKSGNEIITADEMAKEIGTIGYEIVCGISKRVPRRVLY